MSTLEYFDFNLRADLFKKKKENSYIVSFKDNNIQLEKVEKELNNTSDMTK